jgi:hypothetical protein
MARPGQGQAWGWLRFGKGEPTQRICSIVYSYIVRASAIAEQSHKLTTKGILLALEAEVSHVPEEVLQILGGERVSTFLQSPRNHYWVRAWAARALCYAWHPLAFEACLRALHDPHWRVRMNIIRALGLHAISDALEPLCECLKDSHWRVREAAARALGYSRDLYALEALQAAFWDSHAHVQAAIERAIEGIERARLYKTSFYRQKINFWR